jgi:peroxiredoxin
VELRNALAEQPDLQIVWVMAKRQVNPRSLRFVDDYGLRDRIQFWVDPDSRAIDRLGLRRPNPEAIEEGVPHPTTLLLDRDGIIRFADVREDYHLWLDPAVVREAFAQLP